MFFESFLVDLSDDTHDVAGLKSIIIGVYICYFFKFWRERIALDVALDNLIFIFIEKTRCYSLQLFVLVYGCVYLIGCFIC